MKRQNNVKKVKNVTVYMLENRPSMAAVIARKTNLTKPAWLPPVTVVIP